MQRRTELVTEISDIFYHNYDSFEKARLYLSGSYENALYSGFKISYQEDKVQVLRNGRYIELSSIHQTASDTIASEILFFMKKCRIRYFVGDDKWTLVVFDYKHYPYCNFKYRSDFNIEKESTRREIDNFNNRNAQHWIYILRDKWYIEGESCR